MTNSSTSRRLVVATLAFACLSLAVMFPAWRGNLAQAGGYSIMGCEMKRGGTFDVTMSDASGDAPQAVVGESCAQEIERFNDCQLLSEGQFSDGGFFRNIFSFFCS